MMTQEQREEFLKIARKGLEEYGACTGFYENVNGNCCAVGAYAKKKNGSGYDFLDLNCDYVIGVTHGFDGIPYNLSLSQDAINGYEDGKKLREEFIKC